VPAKSRKQLRAMYAAASGRSNMGIPKAVAEKFISETPHKKRKSLMKGKKGKKR